MNLNKANDLYKNLKKENSAKLKEISQARLKTNAKKKIETTFIGCLHSIEQHFGFLWNHDEKDESLLSKDELYYRKIWLALREEILNKGNNQLRALQMEISEYDVSWNKKNYVFPIADHLNKEFKDE